MNWTKNIDQEIAAFEKERGKAVSPELRTVIVEMAAVGDHLEDIGKADARSGRAQQTKEVFIEWGRKMLGEPSGKDNPIVDLLYACYLDGYNARICGGTDLYPEGAV